MRVRLIDRVVEPGAITPAFQPILDIREPQPLLCAVEGLSRGPRGTTLEAPDVLFEFARRKHEEALVDRAAITAILAAARVLPPLLPLQINVHASTLGRDIGFGDYLCSVATSLGVELTRVTLEIVEHSNYVEEASYLASLRELRQRQIGIALDDVGAGISNFRMILLTRPSQLKLDRCLVDGIAKDAAQRATVGAVRLLADQVGAEIVAEGVEREEDLAALRSLGVERVQGYLFSRPRLAEELAVLLPSAPFAVPAEWLDQPAALVASG